MKQNLKINNKTIVFAGGGTGGHVWPLVSIVQAAKKRLGIRALYFGTKTEIERKAWRGERIQQIKIPSGKRRNYFSILNIIDLFVFPYGVIKAMIWLIATRPALVFGKGGYGMLPTALAAKFLGITTISHESDIVLGKANKKILDWGGVVLTAFPIDLYDANDHQKDRLRYVGMPIHPTYYTKNSNKNKNINKTILVFGGSQGAERINKLVANLWDKFGEMGNVIHVTGKANYKKYKYIYSKLDERLRTNIKLYPEVKNIPELLREASVVISRGGATSLWEIVATETPAVVVPLPEAAADHQRLNALWLSQEFPWLSVLEEKNIQPSRLLGLVGKKLECPTETENVANLIMPEQALVEIVKVISEGLTNSYLKQKRHFHLVGNKGVSMQGIEKVLKQMGHYVTGSDLTTGGHSKKNIVKNIDAVIYTSAAALENSPGEIEIEEARKQNIPTIKRSRFISELVNIRKLIAVSGMHGKSTTSTMVAHILQATDHKPSYFIGVPDSCDGVGATNWDKGGNIVVVEACEYDRSFYDFSADAIAITNIEKEHLDYFKKGLPEIEDSFTNFICAARPAANLVLGDDSKSIKNVVNDVKQERPDIQIERIKQVNVDKNEFQIFGEKSFIDAAIAVETVRTYGVKEEDAWNALKSFKGAKRRLEYIGEVGGAVIYDDYGHHPTEIDAVISAVKSKYPNKNLTLVFQPHQASRTKEFFSDFAKTLSKADKTYITDIYEVAGRDEKEQKSSEDLVAEINKIKSEKAKYVPLPYSRITELLSKDIGDKDVVVTIGATDIYKVADGLIHGTSGGDARQ